MKNKSFYSIALLFISMLACQPEELQNSPDLYDGIEQKMVKIESLNFKAPNGRMAAGIEGCMAAANEALAAHNLQLQKIEYLGADQDGNTIIFNDRGNKQLDSDFVPNDPRNGTGTYVPYIIDGEEQGTASGMSCRETTNAIMNAMKTWESVTCSKGLKMPFLGSAPFDIGYVQHLLGFGGVNGFFPGTINHAGVLPSAFFDAISEDGDGGNYILGVTFTIVWIKDIDGNGKDDVAFKEIYMNDAFNWQDAPDDQLGDGVFDFETVVLHEAGHGLSQGHFGKAFVTNKGEIKFAPAALMNAGYSVATREVEGTDKAGHCSNWADWPNN